MSGHSTGCVFRNGASNARPDPAGPTGLQGRTEVVPVCNADVIHYPTFAYMSNEGT